jgi:hypothetical protein
VQELATFLPSIHVLSSQKPWRLRGLRIIGLTSLLPSGRSPSAGFLPRRFSTTGPRVSSPGGVDTLYALPAIFACFLADGRALPPRVTLRGSENPFHARKQRPPRSRHSPSHAAKPRPGDRIAVHRSSIFLDPVLILRRQVLSGR